MNIETKRRLKVFENEAAKMASDEADEIEKLAFKLLGYFKSKEPKKGGILRSVDLNVFQSKLTETEKYYFDRAKDYLIKEEYVEEEVEKENFGNDSCLILLEKGECSVMIKNIKDTTGLPVPDGYGSCIEFWEAETGEKQKYGKGGHVTKVDPSDNAWYIADITSEQNHPENDKPYYYPGKLAKLPDEYKERCKKIIKERNAMKIL